VTTRSRVRGLRFFPAMLVATVRTRRQLARTRGVVRWASVIGGPSEFWTLTVWRSLHEMQEFMRSGAHGEVMWRMPRWLDSFWLARWRPGPSEIGAWNGLRFASIDPEEVAAPPTRADGIDFIRRAVEEGRLTYERSPLVEVSRAALAGLAGAVVRVNPPRRRLPRAVFDVWRLRRIVRDDEATLRVFAGVGGFRDVYLFALWRDRAGAERLFDGVWLRDAEVRWAGRLWALEWLPENEFGHWDGVQMRRVRRRAQAFSAATSG
jgi:hypothetical protein